MTPQVFLIDQQQQVCYRGAIDDSRYANCVKASYLVDAMSEVLAGKPVTTSSANAMGCAIPLPEKTGAGDVTYSGQIARILQDKCQSCHREGQVAPFSLTNYEVAQR